MHSIPLINNKSKVLCVKIKQSNTQQRIKDPVSIFFMLLINLHRTYNSQLIYLLFSYHIFIL